LAPLAHIGRNPAEGVSLSGAMARLGGEPASRETTLAVWHLACSLRG